MADKFPIIYELQNSTHRMWQYAVRSGLFLTTVGGSGCIWGKVETEVCREEPAPV